jgi:hypothetical protein
VRNHDLYSVSFVESVARFDLISDVYGAADPLTVPILLTGLTSKSSARNPDILVSLG